MHLLEKPPRGTDRSISLTDFYQKPPVRGWPERACHCGVRSYHFSDFFPNDCAHFRGHLSKNVYVVMEEGHVKYRRGARMSTATVGSALLIRPGEGEFRFSNHGYLGAARAMILEFDVRAVAGMLGKYGTGEALALQAEPFPEEGVETLEVNPRIKWMTPEGVFTGPSGEDLLEFLILYDFRKAAGLFRSIYYERRWELMRLLERHVLLPDAIDRIAAEYAGGAPQLCHDAALFLGKTPEKWIKRRRMQLAEIWLRFGHAIPAVGKALGYSDEWEFRSVFAAFKKRSCESVRRGVPPFCLSIGELLDLVRPCWWAAPRPLKPVLGPFEFTEEFDDYTYLSKRKKREMADNALLGEQMGGYAARAFARPGNPYRTVMMKKRRPKVPERKSTPSRGFPHADRAAAKLRAVAPEFFATEATGAELLVPIYQSQPK